MRLSPKPTPTGQPHRKVEEESFIFMEYIMSERKKIVFVGGGSLYFELVTAELASTEAMPPLDIVFYDIDAKRNDIMHKVGKRVVEKAGADIKCFKTTKVAEALDGADFAIASVGVHGPNREWHLADSNVCARHGIITTTGDTVGPSGLSQGLRLIPIMVDLAKQMEKYCPDCVMLNHSNPMSPVIRAIFKYSKIHAIGYCHNWAATRALISRALDVKKEEIDMRIGGVNHMGWLLKVFHNGKDVYPLFRQKLKKLGSKKLNTNIFAREVCEVQGYFPIGGDRHIIEFFPHARSYDSRKKIPYNMKWRTEMIKSQLLEAEITRGSSKIQDKADGKAEVWLPKEGERSPESMGEQIKCLLGDAEMNHYVIAENRGAIPNLPDWAALELKAVIGAGGARSIRVGEMPPQLARWTLPQIYAHELTIEAAVEKSREKAIQAMASDPMIRDFKEAKKIFEAIVKAQGDRLKDFK